MNFNFNVMFAGLSRVWSQIQFNYGFFRVAKLGQHDYCF